MALCLVSDVPDDWNFWLDGEFCILKEKVSELLCVRWLGGLRFIQRNSRIHGGAIKSEDQLVKDIRRDVKARLDSVSIKSSVLNPSATIESSTFVISNYVFRIVGVFPSFSGSWLCYC
jgi:hypothetical protein